MPVQPIPDQYGSITPYLIVDGAKEAIKFYQNAFGAFEMVRTQSPDGEKIMHAEIQIGGSIIMLADEFPEMGHRGPKTIGGSAVMIVLYVENADETFAKAIEHGAVEKRPLQDQFYGDRMGTLEDPFGHAWSIATHIEDMSPEEMQKRFKEVSP